MKYIKIYRLHIAAVLSIWRLTDMFCRQSPQHQIGGIHFNKQRWR